MAPFLGVLACSPPAHCNPTSPPSLSDLHMASSRESQCPLFKDPGTWL